MFISSIFREFLKPYIFSLIITSILYFIIGSFVSGMIVLIIAFINVFIISREKYKDQKKFILLDKVNS